MQTKKLTHTPSETVIYKTKDYGRFKFMNGNRDIVENKVKKIVSSIKRNVDFSKYKPVIVNEKMEILDGQHTFSASVVLQSFVYYIISEENHTIQEVAELNTNTDKWKVTDFINCYADQNNKHYIELKEFMDKYKLPTSTAIMLLASGGIYSGNESIEKRFKGGKFEVTNKKFAEQVADICASFEPFFAFHKDRSFIQAIVKLLAAGKYNHQEMLKRLAKHNQVVLKQLTWKEYLTHLEVLYNFRNSKRDVLY